ncbi:hypothetical protein CHELA40_11566 [Chelatococcus asaccharovorans]|nr:hypothetical protein CHELA40_11566 [Chelatococcus asaccharovorans]CAH1684511.1 hypothetical protein CHELA17_64036 [Chelatococcus asaccharovorans]
MRSEWEAAADPSPEGEGGAAGAGWGPVEPTQLEDNGSNIIAGGASPQPLTPPDLADARPPSPSGEGSAAALPAAIPLPRADTVSPAPTKNPAPRGPGSF